MRQVLLSEVMVRPVVSVHQDDSLSLVEEKFRMKGIRHLPVLDHEGKLAGLVSQRDLYRILSPRITEDGIYYDKASLNIFILKRVMTQNPVRLRPEDSLARAVEIMARNKYGCIPVVDGEDRPVGIVTETDVLKYAARYLTGS